METICLLEYFIWFFVITLCLILAGYTCQKQRGLILLSNASSTFIHLFSIVLGLIVGSFLNVVILRLPAHQSLVTPGSSCPKCQKNIRWWDNIPVLSYLFLSGKCRSCRHPISIRYPLIEMLTAFLFLAFEMHEGWGLTLFFEKLAFCCKFDCNYVYRFRASDNSRCSEFRRTCFRISDMRAFLRCGLAFMLSWSTLGILIFLFSRVVLSQSTGSIRFGRRRYKAACYDRRVCWSLRGFSNHPNQFRFGEFGGNWVGTSVG